MIKRNKLKVICFDVDGTLVNTDDVIIQTYIDLYHLYKKDSPIDVKKFKTFSGPPLDQTLKNEFPNLKYDFCYSEYKRLSLINYPKYIKSFENCKKVLMDLKNHGFKLAICSSKIHDSIRYSLKLCGIDGLFDIIVGLDDVKKPKPDKEGIDKILKYFNISQDNLVFVGDTDYDILCAKNSGVSCIIMRMLKRNYKMLNDSIKCFNSYKELGDYLINGRE